jgi:hypothetical protein
VNVNVGGIGPTVTQQQPAPGSTTTVTSGGGLLAVERINTAAPVSDTLQQPPADAAVTINGVPAQDAGKLPVDNNVVSGGGSTNSTDPAVTSAPVATTTEPVATTITPAPVAVDATGGSGVDVTLTNPNTGNQLSVTLDREGPTTVTTTTETTTTTTRTVTNPTLIVSSKVCVCTCCCFLFMQHILTLLTSQQV